MAMGKKLKWGCVAAVVLAAAAFRPGAFDLATQDARLASLLQQAQSPAEAGAVYFTFGDWGGLTTDGMDRATLPEKLSNAALILNAGVEPGPESLATTYQSFGFLTPGQIGNWPENIDLDAAPMPLGRSAGIASSAWPPAQITMGNGTCALCHAGVTYDAAGRPEPDRAWLGMPNTSLNLDAYVQALIAGFDGASDNDLIATTRALYPETSLTERLTLRYAVLPQLRAALTDRRAQNGGEAFAFVPGHTGATNGVDSFAEQMGVLEQPAPNTVTSLPDLSDRQMRTRFLTLGIYEYQGDGSGTPPEQMAELITLFTIPAFGITPERFGENRERAEDVARFLETYRPQPFPGAVEAVRAHEGWAIYEQTCAACHGTYSFDQGQPRLQSFPNWRGDVGTDPGLAASVTPALAAAVDGLLTDDFAAQVADGYAAPPLGGLWASAPYLHSGTVPSIWHLLTPEARPEQFEVGGHAIDFETLGVTYPDGYTPWTPPSLVDTGQPGLGNQGHSFGADLTEPRKRALIAFLSLI